MTDLSTIRRTLREKFGTRGYRITTGGLVYARGALPVDPDVTGWYLFGNVTERGVEPVRQPAAQ